MGRAAKQAKNAQLRQKKTAILNAVKGSLEVELSDGLGDDILKVLKEHNGRL